MMRNFNNFTNPAIIVEDEKLPEHQAAEFTRPEDPVQTHAGRVVSDDRLLTYPEW